MCIVPIDKLHMVHVGARLSSVVVPLHRSAKICDALKLFKVIGFAKQQGLIASAKDCFARLHASDFRISKEVIQAVLSQVGEA